MSNDRPSSSQHYLSYNANDNQNEHGNQFIGNRFIGDHNVINLAPPQATHPYQKQLPFLHQDAVGEVFDQNIERVMNWLQDPMSRVIGVWGMGGVGKTKLLKFIFNKLKEDPSIAGSVYWVDVTQNCNEFHLQEKISKLFGIDLSGMGSVDSRASLLYDKLIRMGRGVLVLDDVWDSFDLENVGIPLTENSCKIIFSTRDVKVCRGMLCGGFVLSVKTLRKEDALELFFRSLRNYEEHTSEMQKIAVKIAEQCHCLPLAIIAIAGSMRGAEDIHEWQNALNELSNLDRRHDTLEDKVLHMLEFSYECLKTKVHKECFLSCALYLEDRRLRREELIHLWSMEGLFDDIDDRSDQLSLGHTISIQLESVCMLEQFTSDWSQDVFMRMHDMMRAMAIAIIKRDSRILVKSGVGLKKIPGKKLWNRDLVKVSLSHSNIKEIPYDMSPETPNLIALLLNDNKYLLEIPESFFVHMKTLKILDLSKTGIERLPDSISDMKDLRALYLDYCNKLKYVPSVEKLTNLRVLGLPKVDGLEMPKGLEVLTCLEKLSYYKMKFSDVNHFNSYLESAQFLSHFNLHVYDSDYPFFFRRITTIIFARTKLYLCERRITIIGILRDGELMPIIPPTAEAVTCVYVTYSKHNNLVDVLPSLAGVSQLKLLTLVAFEGLDFEFIATSASTFLQLDTLRKLELGSLKTLKRITEYGAYSFSLLKYVCIDNCHSLEVGLPVKSAHQHLHPLLPNLQEIQVRYCQELKEIFELDNTSSSSSEIDGSISNPILTLPKLTRIELHGLPKLCSVCRGLLICPSLESKSVEECPKLNLLELSKLLICDTTPASWASIPQQDDDPEWWEPLRQDYPKDAAVLSSFKASTPGQ